MFTSIRWHVTYINHNSTVVIYKVISPLVFKSEILVQGLPLSSVPTSSQKIPFCVQVQGGGDHIQWQFQFPVADKPQHCKLCSCLHLFYLDVHLMIPLLRLSLADCFYCVFILQAIKEHKAKVAELESQIQNLETEGDSTKQHLKQQVGSP